MFKASPATPPAPPPSVCFQCFTFAVAGSMTWNALVTQLRCPDVTTAAVRFITRTFRNVLRVGIGKLINHLWRFRVPTVLLTKKSRTFQDPMKNFPGAFRSPRMFKYKEKTAFTYNIQSVVHCREFSMKQNVDVSCSEFR